MTAGSRSWFGPSPAPSFALRRRRILNEPAHSVADRVRLAGVRPREELRKLSDALESAHADLSVTSNVAEPARLTSSRATTYARRLRMPEDLPPITFTVVGKLTRTDSDAEIFRIVLDRERMPPELDARRRVIEGRYTPEASRQVRDEGLWDGGWSRTSRRSRVFPLVAARPDCPISCFWTCAGRQGRKLRRAQLPRRCAASWRAADPGVEVLRSTPPPRD